MHRILGLLVSTGCLLPVFASSFAGGTIEGDTRLLYFDTKKSNSKGSALGLGLTPSFKSGELTSGLKAEIGFGVSVPVTENEKGIGSTAAIGRKNSNGNSELYLVPTLLNIEYTKDGKQVVIGAQDLETPLIGSDDIRLIRNTFTAVMGRYEVNDALALHGGHILSMAGAVDGLAKDPQFFHAMSDQSTIAKVDDKGVSTLSLVYAKEQWSTQAWFYSMSEASKDSGATTALYADIGKTWEKVKASGQVIHQSNKLNKYTSIGLQLEAVFGDIGIIAALNTFSMDDELVGGTPSYYGWGGYPEYAVADELWANVANWDGGSATKLAASYSGVEKLSFGVGVIDFSDVAMGIDFVIGYSVNDKVGVSFVAESVDFDQKGVDNSRILKFMTNYSF